MKKIYLALTTLLFIFASCSMDLTPEGEIRDDEALEYVNDCESFTNGLYALMRSVTTGDYIVLSDIQLDDFHAVIGNGNRRMEFYNGTFTPSTGEIGSFYSAYYSVIAQTNYFIAEADKKLADKSMTPANLARMNRYSATAHFIRAYCYNCLADKFCGSYKNCENLDEEGTGLSIQLVYAPTANNKDYPARSSMRKTYELIVNELTTALSQMAIAEDYAEENPSYSDEEKIAANSNYINSNTIKSLLSRVYLNMGENKLARDYAEEVIDSNLYPLTTRTNFKSLWTEDLGTEVIWQVAADFTYHGSATGTAFASNTTNSDYVPTNDCAWLFSDNDTRYSAWFEDTKISNSGGEAMHLRFMKYPGNSELYASTSGSNFVNKAKPFRSAELYLISAEASYELGEEELANSRLNALMTSRISGYRGKAMSGLELLTAIQDERHRELIGEGFRLSDLKRWKLGFTRSDVYDPEYDKIGTSKYKDKEFLKNSSVIVSNFRTIHYDASDHRFVWPIPQHEIDTNPQVKQNPGY